MPVFIFSAMWDNEQATDLSLLPRCCLDVHNLSRQHNQTHGALQVSQKQWSIYSQTWDIRCTRWLRHCLLLSLLTSNCKYSLFNFLIIFFSSLFNTSNIVEKRLWLSVRLYGVIVQEPMTSKIPSLQNWNVFI